MVENLTVVIPFYNGRETIHKLVNSIPRTIPILIVDDKSDKEFTQGEIDRAGGRNIRVIQMEKKGYFAGAVNRAIQECETDVLVLNQDAWFSSDAFIQLIESHRRDVAFLGERIRGDHPAFGELGYVHGTFMFVRRDAIREVGLLNEKEYPLWGNTAEYQWRVARKNFKILPLREIPGFHHERAKTERFGSSIKNLLKQEPERQGLLVRTPPLVSVIVPCFNYGRYLSDCVNSLIGGFTSLGSMPGQTLQSFEIIIVDDASTDNSMEFIREIADLSKGIRAYHLERNVGTAKALNFGIEKAVGKYITFLSADDMRESWSLEKLVAACEQNPHSFAYDDVWLFNKHQRIKKWEIEEYDFEKLIWKNQIHAGILFPRQAWVETGGYPPAMGDGREDWAFNVALGVKGWCGVHVKEFGYLYRREGQNRTETNTTELHRARFLAKIMDIFPEIYRGQRPMACCGKGGNSRKNVGINSTFSARSTIMAAPKLVGSEGMEKIEYLGDQMSFTVSGDVTNAKYTFGKDRPRGWVASPDVGSRDSKLGFLSKRDRTTGKWLYKIADTEDPADPSEPVAATEVVGAAASTEVSGTLTAEPQVSEPVPAMEPVVETVVENDYPDPKELTVEELKKYEGQLTKEQWVAVYKAEMAGLNRKGAVSFMEDLLANWQD